MKTIEDLKVLIQGCETDSGLRGVLDSIPKNPVNGLETKVSRHLDDALWYIDLNTEQKKEFILKVLTAYNSLH
jgi:hypothetical protein